MKTSKAIVVFIFSLFVILFGVGSLAFVVSAFGYFYSKFVIEVLVAEYGFWGWFGSTLFLVFLAFAYLATKEAIKEKGK